MKSAVVAVIGIGFLMLLLSIVWGSMFASKSSWTDEKAVRSAEVKARMAYLGAIVNSPTKRNGVDPQKAKAEFDALVIENQQLNDEYTSAAETPQTIAKILKWSGISIAILGVIGWYAVNQSR